MNRRTALLAWYRRDRRDLPWRRTRDPYAIWVSEVMLQQTQVATVIPYYLEFLERFPDVGSLAAAEEDEVLSRWSGLGYYRRARALLDGARAVVDRHGGVVPDRVSTLRELPGIGRYTAGAIASIAFDRRAPVLDGNVRRVLTRWHAETLGEVNGARAEKLLWERAERWVQGDSPGDWNQALMELGATICTPRAPGCDRCPVAACCEAHRSGSADRYPRPTPRKPQVKVDAVVALIRRGDKILLERPADGSPLRGSWDLPSRESTAEEPAAERLVRSLREQYGLELRIGTSLGHADHGILHRRIRLSVVPGRLTRGRVAGRTDLRWQPVDGMSQLPVSGATNKVLRRFGDPDSTDRT